MTRPVGIQGRIGAAAFWLGTPVVIGGILFRPRHSVLVVGSDPFSLVLNPAPSGLIGRALFFYPATLAALALLAGTLALRRSAPTATASWSLPMFFLPTCTAGIETVQLLAWSLRCHDLTGPTNPADVFRSGALLSGAVLLATIAAGGFAARASGRRARLVLPVPALVLPVVLQVALVWWVLWFLARPIG